MTPSAAGTGLSILLVEDDAGLRGSLALSLSRRGYAVMPAASRAEAERILADHGIDLLLLDLRLPDGSGLDVLARARELDPQAPVVVMTAFPDVRTAVRAMREGARDYIVKPFELEELHLTLEREVEARGLRRAVHRLEREKLERDEITEILGESPAIEAVRESVRRVAGTDSPVLILGATGTGKELVADSIHRLSARRAAPLVKVNCSAFVGNLLESELFGHEKGAFTDAREARPGLFEVASGGTIFLDEVGEMQPALQAKLLRAVEGHPFHRVGGHRAIRCDLRVVAATNRDLEVAIRRGEFREDLYYRLNVYRIEVPPLADRGTDVALLARFFLARSANALRKGPLELAPEAEDLLTSYGWPGNARELRNAMERAAIVCDSGRVGIEHLPSEIQVAAFLRRAASGNVDGLPSLAEMERRYIEHVLETTGGNRSEAARILGIARNTLKARIR